MTHGGRHGTTKSRKNENARRKGNIHILVNIGSWHSQKSREGRKNQKKDYLRGTRKLLEKKLYSRNLIKGINTWAVPLVRYSRLFLKWTREELKQMQLRKVRTMDKALHPSDGIDVERRRKRSFQHWKERWWMDSMNRRLHI